MSYMKRSLETATAARFCPVCRDNWPASWLQCPRCGSRTSLIMNPETRSPAEARSASNHRRMFLWELDHPDSWLAE